ncbi:MAG: 50S ribosomal protein L3 [Thiotrichales bacterium]|nr:MAG: 50S ribosomal protein L3 [Thiotrichales bacterium]
MTQTHLLGVIGRKCGSTCLFDEPGNRHAVSIIYVEDNIIAELKTVENCGYNAIKIATDTCKVKKLNKPELGYLKKLEIESRNVLKEFRVDGAVLEKFKVGDVLGVDMFTEGDDVDVSGVTKGHGFTGVIKRHNFAMQDATHGNSLSHRAHGSTGQNQSPGKVFKGKKMAGQHGNTNCTVQSMQILKVDKEKGLLFVKGGVPGFIGGYVIVKPAVKRIKT